MAQRQRNGLIIRGSQVRILLGPPNFWLKQAKNRRLGIAEASDNLATLPMRCHSRWLRQRSPPPLLAPAGCTRPSPGCTGRPGELCWHLRPRMRDSPRKTGHCRFQGTTDDVSDARGLQFGVVAEPSKAGPCRLARAISYLHHADAPRTFDSQPPGLAKGAQSEG
jgi:hypothetical protein